MEVIFKGKYEITKEILKYKRHVLKRIKVVKSFGEAQIMDDKEVCGNEIIDVFLQTNTTEIADLKEVPKALHSFRFTNIMYEK